MREHFIPRQAEHSPNTTMRQRLYIALAALFSLAAIALVIILDKNITSCDPVLPKSTAESVSGDEHFIKAIIDQSQTGRAALRCIYQGNKTTSREFYKLTPRKGYWYSGIISATSIFTSRQDKYYCYGATSASPTPNPDNCQALILYPPIDDRRL
jgi:hypothetical protein